MGHLSQDLSCLADIQCLGAQGLCPDWGQCFFIFKHTQKWSWPHVFVTHRGHQHGWSLALALYSTPGFPAPPGLAGRRSPVQHSGNTLQVYEHVHGAPLCLPGAPAPTLEPLVRPMCPQLSGWSRWKPAGDGHMHLIYTRFGENRDTLSQQLAPDK